MNIDISKEVQLKANNKCYVHVVILKTLQAQNKKG